MASAAQTQSVRSSPARFFVGLGRALLVFAFIALLGAWLTEVTGGSIAGMSQQHLFNDAIALGILGIACLIDSHLHAEGL